MEIERRSRSRRSVTPLTDDLVMEILSRMPAHDVLKCRRVCRRWRNLVSTQHFQEMHLKAKAHHSLMILVAKFAPTKKGALLLLDQWEKQRLIRLRARPNIIDNLGFFGLVEFCYDGLIVMNSCVPASSVSSFTVFNPISRDMVRIETPIPFFNVFGMFFNRLIKEYCILLGRFMSSDVEFRMLNLGPDPCCRTLKQPDILGHMPVSPRCEHPVIIDDATIYWVARWRGHPLPSCRELIMAFDIKTEKFTLLPRPDFMDGCQASGYEHQDTHIMKIDGQLSFAQSTCPSEIKLLTINIWTLKDSAAKLWTKTHSVSIDVSICILDKYSPFRLMAVGSGELLLHWSDRSSHFQNFQNERVYAYNLEQGTLRKIGKSYQRCQFSIFVPSFVSLRNCKPIIRI